MENKTKYRHSNKYYIYEGVVEDWWILRKMECCWVANRLKLWLKKQKDNYNYI